HSKAYSKEFLTANIENLKSEFFIPLMVNKVINDGTATMRVIPTTSNWFGVTYKEDKPQLMAKIEELIEAGAYPRNLWK
ncbi:MAG: nucleotidyltransferase, partial [Alistipes sp.]|nr:nucleotidyltransferase [Alistipes sp.]